MWNQSPKETEKITIPPNVLKNFNVYDILEPQKSGANSDATKVDKLIDIDDDCSSDSRLQDSDFNPTLLDKNRDFDLVDLFQNIFVTPQHIKQKDTKSNAEVPNLCTKALDIDFKQFFDKIESGKKIDWAETSQSKEETPKRDFKVLLEKPKVLPESDSDPEDLIDEVLTQKALEKRFLDEINHSQKVDSYKNIEKSDVVSDCSRLNNSFTKNSKLESGSNENEPRTSDINPVNSQINNSLTNFTLRAIQKDEKVYKKKRIVKPEHVKAKYTKGPGFYEKSVVLPQIMARMNARQAYLDEKCNQKNRLILDAGTKTLKAECSSSIGTDQKIKTNVQSSSVTNSRVKVGYSNSNGTEELKRKENEQSTSGLKSVKPANIPIIKEPQLCTNQQTGSITVHNTAKPCMNCSKKTSTEAASIKIPNDFGKVSPVVLMEDCNRERLKALKQSQRFKNFVLNGTFDP